MTEAAMTITVLLVFYGYRKQISFALESLHSKIIKHYFKYMTSSVAITLSS